MRVTGGFFWLHDEPCIEFKASEEGVVENCTFFSRPRWYQIRQWYRAFRALMSLPHGGDDVGIKVDLETE